MRLPAALRSASQPAWILTMTLLMAWVLRAGGLVQGPVRATAAGAALMLISAGCGWAIRQAWIHPVRLRTAEAMWTAGAPGRDVLEALGATPMVTGELGYRIALLRARALLAEGDRELAWQSLQSADLLRQPFWVRGALRAFLRRIPDRPWPLPVASFLLKLAPGSARLRHGIARLHLLAGTPNAQALALDGLLSALPFASEDPMLLEDLMLAALAHIQAPAEPDLGVQKDHAKVHALFERSLLLLRYRHGDPRILWDRATPALHLLSEGRLPEVLALIPPEDFRDEKLWIASLAALHRLGDLNGAWDLSMRALTALPDSFRLHMERHAIAMERRADPEALRALEAARTLLPEDPGDPARQEWSLRRAEYAQWVENDPELAWNLLQGVHPEHRDDQNPPLELDVMVSLGQFEQAYRGLAERLKRRPRDPELLLLQGECLAGMEAWEALPAFLDHLPEATRNRSEYWHLRGITAANLESPVESRDCLERAAYMEPEDLGYVLDAGHASADLDDWERAEFHWRQALRLDARNAEALVELADARRAQHDPEGAKRLLRECLLHHPDNSSAQNLLAELEAN